MRVDIDKNGVLAISDFAAAQAYKIAIRMEENGIAFYTDLLRLIKDDGVRRELTFLVGEEEAHRVTFLDFLNQEKEEGIDTFEEDDIVSYIHSKVFDVSAEKPAAEAIKGVRTSMAEALNMSVAPFFFMKGVLRIPVIHGPRALLSKLSPRRRGTWLVFPSSCALDASIPVMDVFCSKSQGSRRP
jgi:hypothetical protein